MKLLDRYLLRQFAKNILLVLSLFVAIYLLVDFFERIDEFIQANKPLGLAAKYLLLNIPFMIEQLMPVCILLGGVVTLGLLNHHGELAAMKAGGICVGRLAAPVVAGAVLSSLLLLAMGQWLLPTTVATANQILHEQVRGEIPQGLYRNNRFYYRGKHGFYSFARPDPKLDRYVDFSYATYDDDFRLQWLLSAGTAKWQNGEWHLGDCQTKAITGTEGYKVTTYDAMKIVLPETPTDFFMPEYKLNEMSLTQLYGRTHSTGSSGDREARFKLYERLSYMLLGLPMMLLGLPVLLLVHQRWGRDLSLAIPVSCGLAFLAWGCWGTLQSLARGNYVHPAIAASAIHLLISGLGIWLLKQQDR